jgi:DNA helicase-2/ATP-dependent DNA helicase PcrA
MLEILKDLNEEQRQAVINTEGPILVLAGAGSGKTRALTHRIAYLIREKKVSPFNVLAVTFTNKAAQEMGNRVTSLLKNQRSKIKDQKDISKIKNDGILRFAQNDTLGKLETSNYQLETIKLPWLGTFHSICVRILRREAHILGFSRSFVIYDETDAKSVIKKILKDLKIDPKDFKPEVIKYFISGAKNELIGPKEYRKYINSPIEEVTYKVYERYQKYLKEANAFDFDDLIMQCVVLFEENPKILEHYQIIFKYILIDEYQDTNQAQYVWTKMLARKHKNIMVVGDDYQAIYGWRGANFRNILNFEKNFPGAKVIKLEQNYRSTETILNAANEVIKYNRNKTDKALWTEGGEGRPITVYQALNEKDEAEFICQEIRSLGRPNDKKRIMNIEGLSIAGQLATDPDYSKFAVLYRTNAQSRALEEACMRFDIPYRIVGGIQFYQRKEIKDIVAYLRLIQNPRDFEALERAVSVPPRGIGEKTLEKIRISNIEIRNNTEIQNSKVQNFFRIIEELREQARDIRLDDLIKMVATKTGYKDWVLDGSIEGEGRWENIEELITVASEIENGRHSEQGEEPQYKTGSFADTQDDNALEAFLERVALVQDTDSIKDDNALTLMTLHSAKGLEFQTVFIVGMEEGIFPHSRSLDDEHQLEEERRLCYVGITRAKRNLYLLYAFERNLYGRFQSNPVSRFVDHIPEGLIDQI